MQSYNNLETLRPTYLAPLLCLATLVHGLYHFHILLCHSRFPHTMPYVFSWHPVIRFLNIHKHAIKLRLPFSVFHLRLYSKVWSLWWSLTDVYEQAQCVLFSFVFVWFINIFEAPVIINVCTRCIHSARYAGVLPSLNGIRKAYSHFRCISPSS